MNYKEFQHTDTYKLMVGTGKLISSTASRLLMLITALVKGMLWLMKKVYLWIAKQ